MLCSLHHSQGDARVLAAASTLQSLNRADLQVRRRKTAVRDEGVNIIHYWVIVPAAKLQISRAGISRDRQIWGMLHVYVHLPINYLFSHTHGLGVSSHEIKHELCIYGFGRDCLFAFSLKPKRATAYLVILRL